VTDAIRDLVVRLRAFSPGDVLEAAVLLEDLEKTILREETGFDEAALLSRVLDEFSALVREGVGADWSPFFAGLPADPPAPASRPGTVPPVTAIPSTARTEVDVEVLVSFLSEAQDHLDSIEERILSLETSPDPKTVNEIFRSVHTIKGVSGFLNLQSIKKLSHELEYLLDELRSGIRKVDRSLVDVLLLGCDTLGQLVAEVSQASANLTVAKGSAELLLPEPHLDDILGAISRIRGTVPAPEEPPPPQAQVLPEGNGGEISDLLQSPELIGKFSQEALETLETVEGCVLTMEKTRSTGDYLNEAFRSIHTLKGNAGFFGFAVLESLCMEMESLLDSLRKGTRPIDTEAVELLLSFLDQLRSLVQAPGGKAEAVPATSVAEAPRSAAKASPTADTEAFGKYTVKKKDIRVDTEKLDGLFDLIGELITAEAMVIDSPDLRDLELSSFPRAAAYLSKITRELQAITMSIRMIPLEGLFSKMNRLVRDLGRKFSKEIELEVSGAETEMDRNIIEEISDPLVHIIRNAIDHGIEDDATRKAKGKTPGGRIRLNARYEGSEIWITVADDGAGLDRNRILQVARTKGLVGDTDLSDQEVWNLIFEPGFSTAKEVSEISGRGVGMDVVKKNLEKLRGQVDIATVKDRGTDFVLKIPLTLAIIDGVTLRSGSTLYSIPIADVVEFQNFQPDKVTQTDPSHAVLRLRDEVLPILPLREAFVTQEKSGSSDQGHETKRVSIIIKSQGRKMALVVDEIVGYKQIVLKALPDSMAGLEGISGCTILGNGEVSLIIDVNALFRRYFE
jgi:two-component system chemotaxis sensor kinase CheA